MKRSSGSSGQTNPCHRVEDLRGTSKTPQHWYIIFLGLFGKESFPQSHNPLVINPGPRLRSPEFRSVPSVSGQLCSSVYGGFLFPTILNSNVVFWHSMSKRSDPCSTFLALFQTQWTT